MRVLPAVLLTLVTALPAASVTAAPSAPSPGTAPTPAPGTAAIHPHVSLPILGSNPVISAWMDHDSPTYRVDGLMVRYDGSTQYPYDGHAGTDLPTPTGTPVVAAADGTVTLAGDAGPGGNGVCLDDGGWSTCYFHNQRVLVYVGQQVSHGQLIAISDNTGNSTGPHVHFEVRDGQGHPIDPFGWSGPGPDPWPYDLGWLWEGPVPASFTLPYTYLGGASWDAWYNLATGAPPPVTWTIADASHGVAGFTSAWDADPEAGGASAPASTATTGSAQVPGPGLHTLNLRVWDTLGTSADVTYRYLYDADIPTVSLSVPATPPSSTSFQVTMTGSDATSGLGHFDAESRDLTSGWGWLPWRDGLPPDQAGSGAAGNRDPGAPGPATGSAGPSFFGLAGHTYQFRARAVDVAGNASDWTAASTPVVIPAGATPARPFTAAYTLDGWGGVHGVDSAPVPVSAYWPGWDIGRSLVTLPGGQGGYVLDGWGGLHPFGAAPGVGDPTYWPGWDIARDLALLPAPAAGPPGSGTAPSGAPPPIPAGGYVLDGWGGVHPFSIGGAALPPPAHLTGYWPNWDIARRLALLPDGSGGYVLDGWGGIHPFAIGNSAPPPAPQATAYWPNWDIARALGLLPGAGDGYVLDGWGGLHPFDRPGDSSPPGETGAYWPEQDLARGVILDPASAGGAGWTLDAYGRVHAFGGAPDVAAAATWPGWDIARAISAG
ncbi:MAG: peptidoglycan DD-metalloendopeptidase family protein [Candidatus Dormibacteria bacterium]